MPEPTLGRTVLYRLSEYDAQAINKRRKDAYNSASYANNTGVITHVGNQAEEGQQVPAVIVRVWQGGVVNLQCQLDGNDVYWATSRKEGDEGNCWAWPEVVQ
ncbi:MULTISPECIES: hypothetical protein [unclassified Streptomyces]|uniref:hypothetical protein n=1 Tax=unclassified Streptomyces TaxID=2593676 RepID=UPI003D93C6C9